MIDYEVNIFDSVYRAISPLCARGKVSSQYDPSPTAFPAASLFELANITARDKQSSTPVENFSMITYQLDCYAKTKAECRNLYRAADDKMISLGFTRTSGTYLDNFDNTNVFRYTARYVAEIDREGNIYRIG